MRNYGIHPQHEAYPRDDSAFSIKRPHSKPITPGELGFYLLSLIAMVWIIWSLLGMVVQAKDNGQYAQSPLKQWFDGLSSGEGLYCSVADGRTVDDPDIDMSGRHCKAAVCVRVDDKWLDVPPDAIVNVPNKYGPAVVRPFIQADGTVAVRCFMPGTLS